MKKNLLIPQAFLQYQLISSLKKSISKNNTVKKSSFGTSPLQTLLPLAKIIGPYKPTCVIGKAVIPTKKKISYRLDRHFLNIENHKLSLLVPEIRLYRYYEKLKKYKPFYFPTVNDFNFTGDDKINLKKPYTANSAVIKSFSVDFLGANPYQAGLGMLTANLAIDVDSLSTLFETPDDSYAELADLILMRTGKSKKLASSTKTPPPSALKNGKSLPIMATLGYTFVDKDNIFTKEEKLAINSMKMYISLYYTGHNLSLQQNGSASITAQFHGNLEAADEDYMYNLLERSEIKQKITQISVPASGEHAAKKKSQDAKDLRTQTPDKKGKDEESKKEHAKLKKPDHLGSIMESFSKVFESLQVKGKIHASLYNKEKGFHEFNDSLMKKKKSSKGSQKIQGSKSDAPPDLAGANEINLGATSNDSGASELDPFAIFNKSPYFFYVTFGDLVDALVAKNVKDIAEAESRTKSQLDDKQIEKPFAISVLRELQDAKNWLSNINILFADASFRVKGSKAEQTINIADVPVSVDLIYSQIYSDYVKPKKYFLGLREMLVTLCLKLLNKSMRSIPGADLVEKTVFRVSSIAGPSLKSKIKKGEVNVNEISATQPKSINLKKKIPELIIFHQERCVTTSSSGKGNEKLDYDEGIIHLRTSQDRGLVKTISFQQMQVPGRVEYATVGHGDGWEALRIPQNATVSMFGNTIFFPTMEVYVDPNSLGFGDPRKKDSAARKLGIGGYYSIVKVTTAFNSGVLSTDLQLTFAGYPETRGQPKRTDKQSASTKKVDNLMNAAKSVRSRAAKNRK